MATGNGGETNRAVSAAAGVTALLHSARGASAVPIADPRQRTERALLTGEIPSPVWPAGAGPEVVTHVEVEPGHLVAEE